MLFRVGDDFLEVNKILKFNDFKVVDDSSCTPAPMTGSHEVSGSIPLGSTIFSPLLIIRAGSNRLPRRENAASMLIIYDERSRLGPLFFP